MLAYKQRFIGRGLGTLRVLVVLVTAGIFWYANWGLVDSLAGKKPTRAFTEMKQSSMNLGSQSTGALEAEDKRLKAAVDSNPDNVSTLWDYASFLLANYGEGSESFQPARFVEAIQTLKHILDLDPKHENSILSLAKLNYLKRDFEKAKEYYERYLTLKPKDFDVQASYANTLSFLNQDEKAKKILKQLAIDAPEAFEPWAYLSIISLKEGNPKEALELGEKAITKAKDPEARERLKVYLEAIRSKE